MAAAACLPSLAFEDVARVSTWPFFLWNSSSTNKAGLAPAAAGEPQDLPTPNPSKSGLKTSRRAPTVDGSLQRLTEMPIDIVYEIFMHLEPTDLLNLSRSNRSIRHLLLSRENTRFLWRYALSNVRGLPASPFDMNELQYANLAFDEACHFCASKGVQDVYWVCRVRCCSKCVQNHFVSQEELECWFPDELSLSKPDSIFPYAAIVQRNKAQPETTLYYAPTAREYLSELAQLLGNSDTDGVEKWIQMKTDTQTERIKHAEACDQWYNLWVERPIPSYLSRIPLFDMSVTLVLSVALVCLWKDKLLG